jgi:hypothetical protein
MSRTLRTAITALVRERKPAHCRDRDQRISSYRMAISRIELEVVVGRGAAASVARKN